MKERKDEYGVGDKAISGEITSILGATKDVIVYLSGKCGLRLETSDNYPVGPLSDIMPLLNQINSRIELCICIPPSLRRSKVDLGLALYSTLRNPLSADSFEHFKKACSNIEGNLLTHLKVTFVVTGLFTASFFGGISWILYFYLQKFYFMAAGAGAAGTFLSICFRAGDMSFAPQATTLKVVVDSVLRVAYGLAAGIIAYVLVKANIIGGLLAGSIHGIVAISIVAGFSERLLASVLEKIDP